MFPGDISGVDEKIDVVSRRSIKERGAGVPVPDFGFGTRPPVCAQGGPGRNRRRLGGAPPVAWLAVAGAAGGKGQGTDMAGIRMRCGCQVLLRFG